jgi:KDO2-lipid IV(A) lauroyltransferase
VTAISSNPPTVAVKTAPKIGDRCAVFWLSILFSLTAAAPGVVRAFRPIFIRLAYVFSPKIRHNTRANAACLGIENTGVFGLAVVGSFYDFVCDIGQSAGKTRQQMAARVHSVEGAQDYLDARAAGRGALLITAHMGSFEAGLAALPIAERKVHVVFKRDRLAGFEKLRRNLREQLNVTEAPIDDGWPVWMRLREALLNNEVVAVQGDRVMPGQKGLRVPLASGTIELPTGPFKLALSANAPVIPIFSVRQPDGTVKIVIQPAIEVNHTSDGIEQALRSFARSLTQQLASHPEQWLVLDAAFCG